MADKNKRAVNGQGKAAAPAAGPPGAHGSRFAADLQGLSNQFQELVKNTGGVQEYGTLLEAKEGLEKKLRGMQLEVSQLRKEMEDSKKSHAAETSEMQKKIGQLEVHTSWLQDDYGRKYTEWSESSKSHETTSRELSEAQFKLRESREAAAAARSETHVLREDNDKQERDLSDVLRHCKVYETQLRFRNLEVQELKHKLDEATVERQDAVKQLGILPLDVDSVSRDIRMLADRVQQIAKVVGSELSDPGVAIGLPENFPIQVPRSNSPAARCMRRAAAESLIAEELRRSVLLDFHDRGLNLDGVRSTLEWLETHDHQGESDVIRCQLARALAGFEPDSSVHAKQMASRVLNVLAPWIPDGPTRNQFGDGLAGIFEDAIKLWRPVQQAKRRVRAEFDLALSNWHEEEDRREDFDGSVSGGQAPWPASPGIPTNFGAPIAVLFPHIKMGPAKPDNEIFYGSALFQNQPMVVEACRELQSQQASAGISRRRQSIRNQPASRNRRVSSSSVDEVRLRRGSVGMATGAAASQRSPVGPETTASVSSTRSQKSGATTNGR